MDSFEIMTSPSDLVCKSVTFSRSVVPVIHLCV